MSKFKPLSRVLRPPQPPTPSETKPTTPKTPTPAATNGAGTGTSGTSSASTAKSSTLPTRATQPRPTLPTRSKSNLTAGPPADSIKADSEAIRDVFEQVDQTGSIEAAARMLSHQAKAWEDDPEERDYVAGPLRKSSRPSSSRGDSNVSNTNNGAKKPEAAVTDGGGTASMTLAKQRMMQAFADEEDGPVDVSAQSGTAQRHDDDNAVFDDEDDEDHDTHVGHGGENGEQDEVDVVHLQQVQEGLWIGDLVAAMDSAGLEQRGITNIVSLLRPRLSFPPQFAHYALEIDDAPDTDILSNLPKVVQWIQEALDRREASLSGDTDTQPGPKPGDVLVHCQAGVSRSSTVVAAYLMRAHDLDPVDAVDMIRLHRPQVDPSDTFWQQLGLFCNADGKVSLRDRPTRQWYMERTASNFINGDGTAPSMDKMAKYPATPTPSNPPTPMGGHGRRKIRCKMCRRQLAIREHMMDHILDQAPQSRPRTPSNFALPSPSVTMTGTFPERRGSVVSDVINPLTGLPGATKSRQSSFSSPMPMAMTAMTSLSPTQELSEEPRYIHDAVELRGRDNSETSMNGDGDVSMSSNHASSLSIGAIPSPKGSRGPALTMTAASPETDTGEFNNAAFRDSRAFTRSRAPVTITPEPMTRSASANPTKADEKDLSPAVRHFQSAEQLASRLPPHLLALRQAGMTSSALASPVISSPSTSPDRDIHGAFTFPPAQSQSAGAQGAARRMSLLAMTPTDGAQTPRERRPSNGSQSDAGGAFGASIPSAGPPILVNPKCSGYFVEPLTWMEPVLKNGDISGKLVCPNEKCGAKIGNFDWAGVQCGCKEWVTPGFCIHRSKVDEVW